MPILGGSIPEYEFNPDAPPSVVGQLTTGRTVTIEVWQNGQSVSITSNVCNEIGSTGKYSWSTGNILTVAGTRNQYQFRMTDDMGDTDDGEFILATHEGDDGQMPSLNNKTSYIKKI